MPYLLIKTHDGHRSRVPIESGQKLSIGRASSNEIVLNDPGLSRHHAVVQAESTGTSLSDCRSRNGTFVDGHEVHDPILLRPGCRIAMGRCSLIYADEKDSGGAVVISDDPADTSVSSAVLVEHADDSTAPGIRDRTSVMGWREQLRRLQVLERANLELLAHDPVELLLPKVLELVFEAVSPERAALLMLEDDGKKLSIQAFRSEDGARQGEIELSQAVVDRVVHCSVSVLISDVPNARHPLPGDSLAMLGVKAVMAVPLTREGKPLGMIYADSRRRSGLFGEDDLRVLTALANIASIQIENATRFEELQRRLRLMQEVQAAAELQRRLLPRGRPQIPHYDVEGVNIPCYEVGGDYYDYVRIDDQRFGIVLGDVAGKGLAAGMIMMGLHATFRAEVALGPEPDHLLARLNEAAERYLPRRRFITLCYVELNRETHRLRWSNAGHVPAPLLFRRTGAVESLDPSHVPLGVMPGVRYAVGSTRLEPGDRLVMCSDGVTETFDPADVEFGIGRLRQVVLAHRDATSAGIMTAVDEALHRHAGETTLRDDLTMVVIRRSS